jgi:thioredoxin reductase (NADPH)
VTLDERGLVATRDGPKTASFSWETGRRGIFTAGDVGCGSAKRIAASVRDGAKAVSALHRYLAQAAQEPVPQPLQRVSQ